MMKHLNPQQLSMRLPATATTEETYGSSRGDEKDGEYYFLLSQSIKDDVIGEEGDCIVCDGDSNRADSCDCKWFNETQGDNDNDDDVTHDLPSVIYLSSSGTSSNTRDIRSDSFSVMRTTMSTRNVNNEKRSFFDLDDDDDETCHGIIEEGPHLLSWDETDNDDYYEEQQHDEYYNRWRNTEDHNTELMLTFDSSYFLDDEQSPLESLVLPNSSGVNDNGAVQQERHTVVLLSMEPLQSISSHLSKLEQKRTSSSMKGTINCFHSSALCSSGTPNSRRASLPSLSNTTDSSTTGTKSPSHYCYDQAGSSRVRSSSPSIIASATAA